MLLWFFCILALSAQAGPISTINRHDKLDLEYQDAAVVPTFLQGLAALEQNHLPKARQAFEAVLKQDPNFVPALVGLAGISNSAGNDQQTMQYLDQAHKIAPKAAIVFLAKGRFFLSKQQLGEAEQQFLLAKDLQSNSGHAAKISLGELYLRDSKRVPEALELFQQALKSDANNGYVHYLAGVASALLAQPAPAQQYFEAAVRLSPDNVMPLQALSRLLMEQQRPEQAVVRLKQALDLEPTNLPILLDLSDAFAVSGQFSEASSILNKAEQLAPKLADVYLKKADVAQAQQQWDSALRLYDQAIELNNQLSQAFNNKAWVLLSLKRDLPHAKLAAQQAVLLSPGSAPFHDTLAMILLELNDHPAALAAIDQAISLEAAVAEYHYHKGLIAIAMKQFAVAKQALQKALQLDPSSQAATQALTRIPS
jgi:tetratricopeptide (TPR) repeat protein